MQTKHAKLITGLVVVLLAVLALGATAITTINAQRRHEEHESRLRRLSERAAKVLPKEAFKPGAYTLRESHYVDGYRVFAVVNVDEHGQLVNVAFNQLDQFGLNNPATATDITRWNTALLKEPNVAKLSLKHGNKQCFQLYQNYMGRLIHAAHTGEQHQFKINNHASTAGSGGTS
ncbi:hypothetical protein [Furfurilactobacillus milii]|uniref:Uncharacterized protein n=1 Tax=Furfurilactobacillus milii TaxID=2888272 RepID=A0A6N9I0E5_9LACO|nr:hypothetical protein [Furfurilactobacillus milii]MYV16308.1 hypothetical protein [Furfurilactobacillus milii]